MKAFKYGFNQLQLTTNHQLGAAILNEAAIKKAKNAIVKHIGHYQVLEKNELAKFATATQPVYHIQGEQTIVIPTGNFYVEFSTKTTSKHIQKTFKKYNLSIIEKVDDKAFLVEGQAENVIELTHQLQADSVFKVAEPDLMADTAQYSFQVPTDELLSKQWYIHNDGIDPYGRKQHWKYRKGADAKVIEAWEILWENKGFLSSPDVTIAVLDKGFDLDHPDLKDKLVAPRDFYFESSSFIPKPFAVQKSESDSQGRISTEADHGTSCAGIACADANGRGIVGIAPNSKFMPIRYYVANGTYMRAMFRHMMANGADVASCSFGNIGLPMDRLTIQTLHKASTEGRNGKGMVIVFATGNAFDFLKDNELATHPDVIAVGATTSEDTFAPYTNRTTSMSVVAPGGYGHSGTMTTADVGYLDKLDASGNRVQAGKGKSDNPYYRTNAEGTSFACPVVAGVAALVLSANPNLTGAEVKSILETTADQVGDAGDYDATGRSSKFGFGRVNAANAVRKALGLPLKDYLTSPAVAEGVKPFIFEYGQTIKATHSSSDKETTIKYTVAPQNAGKTLLLELDVSLDHDIDNEFELYIQKGKKPIFFPEDFIEKRLGLTPKLTIPNIQSGDYYLMVRCINKKTWDYVAGGGDFEINLTFSNPTA